MAVRLLAYSPHVFRSILLHFGERKRKEKSKLGTEESLSKNWANSTGEWTMSIVNFAAPPTFTISDAV